MDNGAEDGEIEVLDSWPIENTSSRNSAVLKAAQRLRPFVLISSGPGKPLRRGEQIIVCTSECPKQGLIVIQRNTPLARRPDRRDRSAR